MKICSHGYFDSFSRVTGERRTFTVRLGTPGVFNEDLFQRLGEYALTRGVARVNIVDTPEKLKFVRVTCRSMTIPVEVLTYVHHNQLPLELLEQPELIDIDTYWNVSGDGIVIALKGAVIARGVNFRTEANRPIILRENCTLSGNLTVNPGTIVPPKKRLSGPARQSA